ncbi:MAG TPA: hypothetical protein VFI31_17075 [Pirellulales bacterium]|nr:hypothetical protein [Pirellulales bacterium]
MATVPARSNVKISEPVLPEDLESSEEYRNVLTMTQRLFPGLVVVRREQDPELPEEYVVFEVQVKGTLDEIMALDRQWHQECCELARMETFPCCLAMTVQDESE